MTEEQKIIYNMFRRSCWFGDEYDHLDLSAYRNAQEYLIKHKIIKKSECNR